MKCLRILALAFVLSGIAFGQCAYTFTWKKPPSFSFCVTPFGTLGKLQSPIGVDHLDHVNPVEGYAWVILDDTGGKAFGSNIPGLGTGQHWDSVSQPKGPGSLPLIFTSDDFGTGSIVETITANHAQRSITIALRFNPTPCDGCIWWGFLNRTANLNVDGKSTNFFGSSANTAFSYSTHSVMLVGDGETLNGQDCAGIDPNGSQIRGEYGIGCTGPVQFAGSGAAVYSFGPWGKTQTFTYKVF